MSFTRFLEQKRMTETVVQEKLAEPILFEHLAEQMSVPKETAPEQKESEEESEEETPDFFSETPPVFEDVNYSEKDLYNLSKFELDMYAETKSIKLDRRKSKSAMIKDYITQINKGN